MGKFKFEVLGIGDICAICPKMNSILTVDDEDHIKTKLTGKGIDNCCIDDDSTKRSKKVEEKEGGVIEMKKKMKDGTHKDRTMIRHANMKYCVLHGMKGDDVEVWRIETIKQDGPNSHNMVIRKHIKKTIAMYDDKIYLLVNDYHSIAYGHKDCGELIPTSKVRKNYHTILQEIEKGGGG